MGDTLVGAMKFNVYYPIVEAIGFGGIRFAKRLKDCLLAGKDKEGIKNLTSSTTI